MFEIQLKSLFLPRIQMGLCPVSYLATLPSGFVVCGVYSLLFASIYKGPSWSLLGSAVNTKNLVRQLNERDPKKSTPHMQRMPFL